MKSCPKCGNAPAIGTYCQRCGERLIAEPSPEVMVTESQMNAAVSAVKQQITMLESQNKALDAINKNLQSKHDDLAKQYATLLSAHTAALAEIEKMKAVVSPQMEAAK